MNYLFGPSQPGKQEERVTDSSTIGADAPADGEEPPRDTPVFLMKSLAMESKDSDPSSPGRTRRNSVQDPTCGGNYLPPSSLPRPLLHARLGRGGKLAGSRRPLKAFLSYYQKTAGAANTAFPFQFSLQPNLDASFADFQQTFDEFKVLAAEIFWQVNMTTLPTAFAAQAPNAALAYEPAYNTVLNPGAVNQVLEYERFSLVSVAPVNGGANTYSTNTQSTSRNGMTTFKIGCPGTPLQSEDNILLSTGMWRPTADARNYYWGAFVGYCAAGGATSVLQVEAFVRMVVEFRSRR